MFAALQGSDRTSVRLFVGRWDYQEGKASPNVKPKLLRTRSFHLVCVQHTLRRKSAFPSPMNTPIVTDLPLLVVLLYLYV